MRFSLKALLGWTAYAALVSAGVGLASDNWSRTVVLVTLLMLLAALVLAIFGSAGRRAAWGGFAIVGGLYFYLTLVLGRDDLLITGRLLDWTPTPVAIPVTNSVTISPYATPAIQFPAATAGVPETAEAAPAESQDSAAQAPAPYVPSSVPLTTIAPPSYSPPPVSAVPVTWTYVSSANPQEDQNRRHAGHCGFAVLFGLLGAAVGRRAARQTRSAL